GRAVGVWPLDERADLRRRLGAFGRGSGVAPLLQRLLGVRSVRSLLGLPRSLGLGPLSLWSLELVHGIRMGLGTGRGLLRRVGLLVLRAELRRLGPPRLLELSLLDRRRARLRRVRLPELELRDVQQCLRQ